jgi:hypothetical protein
MAIELRIHWLHRLVARWPLQDQRDAVPQLVGQDLIGIILRGLDGWGGGDVPLIFAEVLGSGF